MKNLFFLLLILGNKTFAQIPQLPNSSFENWVDLPNTFGGQDPDGWTSNNKMIAGFNRKGIRKTTDACSGQYALEVSPIRNLDGETYATTVVCVGSPILDYENDFTLDTYGSGGIPAKTYDCRQVSGCYKLTNIQEGDSVYMIAINKDHPAGQQEPFIRGEALYVFEPSDEFKPFSFLVDYVINGFDYNDSIVVAIYYKSYNTSPTPSNKLIVDDLVIYHTPTAVEEQNQKTSFIFTYNNKIRINYDILAPKSAIKIYDISGKMVQEHKADDRITEVELLLNNGIYLVELLSQDGKTVIEKIQILN